MPALRVRGFEPLGMIDTAYAVTDFKERLAKVYGIRGSAALHPVTSLRKRIRGAKRFPGRRRRLCFQRRFCTFSQMLCNGGELANPVVGRKA